jgi:hypothetical protein
MRSFRTLTISSLFTLTDRWIPSSEAEAVELLTERYSDRPCDSHAKVEFSFTVPVTMDGFHMLYCKVDRGFLSAHGFFCRFTGEFAEPAGMEFEDVWQSLAFTL